jgi:hypothetical protein
MTPDKELLRAVLARIKQEQYVPGQDRATWWDQGYWRVQWDNARFQEYPEPRCGTSMCFAGWTPIVAGVAYDRLEDGNSEFVQGEHVADWSRKRLGLTEGQANALFFSENTIEDLERMVDTICAGGIPYLPLDC